MTDIDELSDVEQMVTLAFITAGADEEIALVKARALVAKHNREIHKQGYECARDDMVSGAFIGGPNYEALKNSYTGRQIILDTHNDIANAWEDSEEAIFTTKDVADAIRKKANEIRKQ